MYFIISSKLQKERWEWYIWNTYFVTAQEQYACQTFVHCSYSQKHAESLSLPQEVNLNMFMQIEDNEKLGGVADRPGACASIQRDTNRVERWANRKHMKQPKMPSPCRKGSVCSSGYQVEHESARSPCSKEGQQPPVMDEEECFQEG